MPDKNGNETPQERRDRELREYAERKGKEVEERGKDKK